MVKIEAIIQPSKLADVKTALQDLGVGRVSISGVLTQSAPSSPKVFYRGAEYCSDTPMMKIEMLVSSFSVDEAVEVISRAARTGFSLDDGTITIYEVADAISIRSGERVQFTLS